MNPNDDPGRSYGDFCGVCGEEILVSRDYVRPWTDGDGRLLCWHCAKKAGDRAVARFFHREYRHKEAV